MPSGLRVPASVARRFLRRALLLDQPVATISAALDHLGYVQIDPVNVCGRMHDHILRHRVAGYREGDLQRHLHGDGTPRAPADRTAFEHHLPGSGILGAFPLEAWPHLLGYMRSHTKTAGVWSGRLTPRERELADRLLAEIAARGPLGSDAIADVRRAKRVWGAATLVKSTLQKLFFHGRLLIARRDGIRRLYDLPDRVLPPEVLNAAEPAPGATARWLVALKIRQRRLVTLRRAEIPLVADLVEPVHFDGCPVLHCLRDDLPLLESFATKSAAGPGDLPSALRAAQSILLLAPLDPLIYDRRVTRSLWNFDYTWEAYVPPAKRVRGHYALPVLVGDKLVGHVDPKADRTGGRLRIVSRSIRRGFRVAPAVKELARFLGLR
ncbi:MAG: hypothetical protein A3G75_09535 [Verrucomicrobia bacterium RIFCSPLOWO2_12_FULL_64_8]|nr:MAG: hypothetical protein A3G75_09535 [Verrucomicrobia bacterium RIFCSPLOWO2_12_FULL_64_8]